MKLTINKSQAQEIASALELQSRLLCGQFQELDRLFVSRNYDMENVEYVLRQLKKLIFPELDWNASYGLGSRDVDKRVDADYHLYKQIKHELHKNDEHWSVHKDPHLMCSEENKIMIEGDE